MDESMMPAFNQCQEPVEFFVRYYNDETGRPHVRAIFGLFYAVAFVAGLIGNGLVIASVWRYPALQTVRNFFIVSLSCSDMVVCLTSLPITPFTVIEKNWLFGSFLCYAFPLFQGMSILISTFTLMAVAVDRYILIIFPTQRPIQRAQAVPMIIGIWALAAGLCLPMVAHYKYFYGPDRAPSSPPAPNTTESPTIVFCGHFCEESWPSERVQKIYGTFVLILQFLVPLLVIAFCYSHIWLRLARSAKMKKATAASKKVKPPPQQNQNQQTDNRSCGSQQQQPVQRTQSSSAEARQQAVLRRKRRTNRMLIAMVFIFACSWCPQVTMNILRDLGWLPQFIVNQMYFYSLLCHAIAMSSTVWNPLLYSFMNGAFRSAFSELMPCFGRIKRALSGRASSRARYQEQLRQPAADNDDSNLGANGAAGGAGAGGGAGNGSGGRDGADGEEHHPILVVSSINNNGGETKGTSSSTTAGGTAISNRRVGAGACTLETVALLDTDEPSKSINSTTN